MSFLYGALAGVRSHLSSFGTGAGRNGERSRRHTISAVVTSVSSPLESGLRPAGILRAENSNTDRAGRTTTVQHSDATKIPPTKRNRHKSVTFSSVDVINHLPTPGSTSSHTKSPEFSIQNRRRNSTSSPTSVPPSGLSNRHGHRTQHCSEKSRRRRYTVSGPPLPPRLSSPQDTDPEAASYSPLDSEYQDGSWYDHPTTLQAGPRQEMLQTRGKRSSSVSFGVIPSIGDSIDSQVRIENRYSIYRVDPPSVVSSPISYLSEPARRYSEFPISYSFNGVDYTILPLTSRLSPPHTQPYSYTHPECLALLDTRTASLVPSRFPPPKFPLEGKSIFVISQAPNKKGLGMFAQKPLRTGEVILTEVPTLIIPSDAPTFFHHSGSAAVDASTIQMDMYDKMFDLLSDGVKKELMNLAWGGAYSDYRSHISVYETIMRINPLAVSLPHSSAPCGGSNVTSSIYRGIFLKTSRCNHSCGPNAQWTFDPSSLTLNLTCLRPINTDDEITISYISSYLPFFQRRADLKNLFGFDCSCDCCFRILSQSHLIEESDSARRFLTTFWNSYPSFEVWSQRPSIYSDNLLISAHKIALEAIEREGLEGLSSVQPSSSSSQPQRYTYDPVPEPIPDTIRHTDRIALCYGVIADVSNFRKWVARALDVRLSHSGPGSVVAGAWGAFEDIRWTVRHGKSLQESEDDVGLGQIDIRRTLENWIVQPEAFPAWGLRRSSPGET